jgi:hypothetical protein
MEGDLAGEESVPLVDCYFLQPNALWFECVMQNSCHFMKLDRHRDATLAKEGDH